MEIILIVVVVAALLIIISALKKKKRPARVLGKAGLDQDAAPDSTSQKATRPNDMRVPENQLRVIRENTFRSAKPINKEAFKQVFHPIEKHLQDQHPGFRLFAEVGMGSFIQAAGKGVSQRKRNFLYSAYGSKRIDFLIIDPMGNPAIAIEYQGSGHNQRDDTFARDGVKRAILFAAGIRHFEIQHGTPESDMIAEVAQQLAAHREKSQLLPR